MILDYANQYCDAQALTATAASTNVIDHVAAGDIGHGEPMAVVMVVDVAADYTTEDETYTFVVQKDTVENFASAETVYTETIAAASLTAGSQHVFPIPPGKMDQQYSRLYPTLGGTTPTITITAALVPMDHIQDWKAYPDAL